MSLPLNVTSLIQPMDQGVLEALKCRCRKSLLQEIMLTDSSDVLGYLKKVNMLTVVMKASSAWEITRITLRR